MFFVPLSRMGLTPILILILGVICSQNLASAQESTRPFPRAWDSCSSSNSACPQNFYCSDDRCECRDAIYKRKDHDLRSCQTIVSGSCEYDEECVKNSFCNTITRTCTCRPGSLPTPMGECRFDVGVPCNFESIERECNLYEGLYCIEGRCACADSSLVYELGAGCRAQVGALCGKILLSWEGFSQYNNGVDRFIRERPVKCGRGLRCPLDEGDFSEKGICVENTP
ncbi:uncharacterized protein LOC110860974 [Folsomia candida]|uniref:EB domain-containing protein n=1 Tax=Folsomia candida TaxID=158441 RepID=A0A226D2X4_FOLCA|nr:uncharacterized protein LOC110860974 [Folsomia candida]OXA39932.1 hypothetical protein Fcan01_25373 [Folsomia candida]